ncbi:MAG: alpha-glucosidase C-terminal domain-containing protein [Deltaproteobacteria bacterium]|nr:alpha-glucosidase C-terminal domain-containing protein [Deltaproteobacteria bacterium]
MRPASARPRGDAPNVGVARRVLVVYVLLVVAALSCGGGEREVPTGTGCPPVVIEADGPEGDALFVRGTWNAFDLSTPMAFSGSRWTAAVSLSPGDYGYQFYSKTRDSWSLDAQNPLTIFVDGQRLSRLTVESCNYPRLEVVSRPEVSFNAYTLRVRFVPGASGAGVDLAKSTFALNGDAITPAFDASSNIFTISRANLPRGQYRHVFKVIDANGFAAKTLYAPVWVEAKKFDWRDAVIYQVMTDRFFDGDQSNNAPLDGVDARANWQGGDFAGIKAKVEGGYFDTLGVSAIWISSPLTVATRAGKGMGGDTHFYAPYHAYWPIASGWTDDFSIPGLSSPIEPHFGTGRDFHALIDAAHARGIRVMFDFVPNHVHEDAYLYREHENDGWFNLATPGLSPNRNGGYTCGWERPVECWFADYLPDLDHRNTNATDTIVAHALWLTREFGADGLRIDAVRLMIPDLLQALRTTVRREVETTGIPFYMVGETFTDDRGWDEIGSFLGENRLGGQFDFPLFHHLSRAVLLRTETLAEFAGFVEENDGRYERYYRSLKADAGSSPLGRAPVRLEHSIASAQRTLGTSQSGALMANFVGNHDLPRALSVANGDFDGTTQGGAEAGRRAWEDSPKIPSDESPYLRLRMALAFLFTSPGIPTVFQGDEFGMPGANDPDNRRIMAFGEALSAHQKATLEFTEKLGRIRAEHSALRRGTRKTIAVEDDLWVYRMEYAGDSVFVGMNRSSEPVSVDVTFESNETTPVDALGGGEVPVISGKATLEIPSEGVAIFVVQ